MNLPQFMLDQRRWCVRTNDKHRAKLPQAAFDTMPSNFTGDPSKWRYAWSNPATWSTIDQALGYWGDNDATIAGLCYVLHPAEEREEQLRLMCFDFDNCFDGDTLDPDVVTFVEELNSYAEVSLSGRGLHVFAMVLCKPFRNTLHCPIGGCKVDVLCSAQVAVTGQVYDGYATLNTVNPETVARFSSKDPREKADDLPDFWADVNDGLRPDHKYLVPHMEAWDACIEGQGGDKQFYKAACFLARHGATGWDGYNLLGYVEQLPPFDVWEIQHKVDSAWLSTQVEEEFGVDGLDIFDAPISDTEALPPDERLAALFEKFEVRTAADIQKVVDPKFLIEDLFVDKESLFIGGREKSFKTGMALDLAISLASGAPFLGRFPIESKRRILVFTAEIGEPAIKLWINRISREKGIDPVNDNLLLSAQLPNMQIDQKGRSIDPLGCDALKDMFSLAGIDACIFDPLYFALLGTSLGDMNAVGGVLRNITETCKDADVWPIICHHARKDATKEYQPMQLGDLSGSGVPAFARQWLLSSHAEDFADGQASLYVRTGGSTPGDRGLWRVSIHEGIADELVDRKWEITVESEDDYDGIMAEDAHDALLKALRYHDGILESVGSLAMFADIDANTAKKALVQLVHEDLAVMQNSKFKMKD